MSKDETDFMLEEYKQVAKAFFNLYVHVNNILKLYLALISIGSTAIITILTFGSDKLLDYPIEQIAGGGFFILSLVGITIMLSIIGTRIQMLLYARTINSIRRYFADKYNNIKDYLLLPISADTPSYFEKPNHPFFGKLLR